MSTNYSPKVRFYDDDGEHDGQLVWHNTSSTVSWMVDGEDRYCMGSGELLALQLAASADAYGPGGKDEPLTDKQRDEIRAALPYIGGFKNTRPR